MTSTVLIVDDDLVSRLVLRHMVEGLGMAVIEAPAVDQALEVLSANHIDLIVCDYLMPDRDGLDLLDALSDSAPPFILITGVLDRADLNDERVDGVTDYLTKPVSSDALEQAVSAVVTQAA